MPKSILVVEDEEHTRSVYASALAEYGYRVLTARHGAEAVHLARRHKPDLILMDLRMPVMDGWQALRYLRSYPPTQRIPVCAISAYAPEQAERQAVERMGFDCFLMKPIELDEILKAIDERIGPPLPLPRE